MLFWGIGSESVKTLRGFLRVMLIFSWPALWGVMWLARRGAASLGWGGLWGPSALAGGAAALLLGLPMLKDGPGPAAWLAAVAFAVVFAVGVLMALCFAKFLPDAGLAVQAGAAAAVATVLGAVLLNYILP